MSQLTRFDIAMLLVIVLCFLLGQGGHGDYWYALGAIALGLIGLANGGMAVWRRHDIEVDGESDTVTTRTGWAAVIHGLGYVFAGLVAALIGIVLLLGEEVRFKDFVHQHLWSLIGLGGIWIALRGAALMLGSEESRPETPWGLLLQPWRLIGLVVMLAGLAIAFFCLTGTNPLQWVAWQAFSLQTS